MTITWMNLKDARGLKGWTQSQLAEAIGVHQKTIVNWEATGVPAKREYMLYRVLRDELNYTAYANELKEHGQPTPTFEEWLAAENDGQIAWATYDVIRGASETEVDEGRRRAVEDESEQRRLSLEAHVESLARFTSYDLLDEVARRLRVIDADARINVALSNVRASNENPDDYDLAARPRSADRGEDLE